MRYVAFLVTLLTSIHCYAGFNLKTFVNKHVVPIFVPPPPPAPPSPSPAAPQQGFWAGPNGDGGCIIHDQMRGARNTMERMNGPEDIIQVDPGSDILDLIFDWDRAHKRFGKVSIELNVWKKEPFNLEDCGRLFKEFQADMNQLNRMKDAELITMGGVSAAGAYFAAAPLIVGGAIVVGLPALAASAFVAFKKWTVQKSADKNMENYNKCVDMQNKKLEELQEKARRKIQEIEERKKKEKEDEKIEIEDIEV